MHRNLLDGKYNRRRFYVRCIEVSMVRKMAIILMVCVLGLGSCAFLNLDKKEEKDNTNLLLLLFGAAYLNSQGCKNNSGLVICIPPGVPN